MNRATFTTRVLGLALLTAAACGEPATTPDTAPEDGTAAAYEALATSLQACDDELAACTAAAAGDTAKLAACDSAAAQCKSKTAVAEERAKDGLKRDAEHCWKRCRKDDDDAGAAHGDDAGAGDDMPGCVGGKTPRVPACVRELVGCLREAGAREGDATRREIFACVQSAHECFREGLRRGRGRDRERAEAGRAGSAGAAGAAGASGAGTGGSEARRGEERRRGDSGRDRRSSGWR